MREKLIELLKGNCYFGQKCPGECTGCMADHLIANGVTIQTWIPVTERLPELDKNVLMYFKDGKNMTVGFLLDTDEDRTFWMAYCDDAYYIDCDFEPTHWMPLPEAPKEGEG